jgi:DNA-binding MarR family transcriptional regulator
MPVDFSCDPRTELVRKKYFSMRPRGLERWLWQQQLPRAAERVFWLHWDAGHRNRNWCSQIPIRAVAEACCMDPATVTRAYQMLQKLGLLRRESSGRDPTCPFQQPVALTEVRIPQALLAELAREPNRRATESGAPRPETTGEGRAATHRATAPQPDVPVASSFRQAQEIFNRLSPGERARFHAASLSRALQIEFDSDSRLSPAEQKYLLNALQRQNRPPSAVKMPAHDRVVTPISVRPRLSPVDFACIQRRVADQEKGPRAGMLAREVAWAVGEGALARFGPRHGLNIALKKIREGTWTRPHRMPPNAHAAFGALLESCSAA